MRFAALLSSGLGVGLSLLVACGSPASSGGDAPAAAPSVDPPATPDPVRGAVHLAFAQSESVVTKVQWGEPFAARIDGLIPGEKITLRASSKLADGNYLGEAVFAADAAGAIDTSKSAALSGAYTGADADGLVWSMAKTTKAIPAADQYAFHLEVVASDGAPLAKASLARWYLSADLTRTEVSSNGLVGVYYATKGAAKKPAIVTFGGSEGGLDSGENAAMYWASRGYVALGLAYFAAPGVPNELDQIPLEYFAKAFEWLDQQPEADATKLAVMGGSRGGELALLLGATFPRIHAVVADVPSGVSWGAPHQIGPETSSWTYQTTKVPFVPYLDVPATDWKTPSGDVAGAYTPVFRAALAKATAAEREAASFHVENTNGPILMLAGQDDQVWPSCDLAKVAMDRLVAAGHDKRFPDASVCYPESGHASGWTPGVPTTLATATVHPLTGELLALGGTPKGIAHAQRDSFARIDAFLRAALK